jgi:transposase
MIRVGLSNGEVGRLEQALSGSDDPKLRTRLQIVLMAHRGRPHRDIASDLTVAHRTVQRWLNAYLAEGLDGLRPKKAKGNTSPISGDWADEIKKWVVEGPIRQGLSFANWTYAALAEHLRRVKGVRTSRSAVARFCAGIGIRPYRPSYRYLRADAAKQQKAREDLAGLKKSCGR